MPLQCGGRRGRAGLLAVDDGCLGPRQVLRSVDTFADGHVYGPFHASSSTGVCMAAVCKGFEVSTTVTSS